MNENFGPLVSIIMPLYNGEKYIKNAIESILRGSYYNFELIIVDDGSSDGSAAIVKELSKKDSRIKYFFEENKGICAARNMGLSKASGEYIAFCDDDDEYDRDLIKDNLECLIKKDADIVKFGRGIRHVGGKNDGWNETFNIPEGEYLKNDIRKKFAELEYKGAFLFVWDSIFKRSLISIGDELISFDTSFTSGYEDVDFNLRIVQRINKIIVRDKIYYTHFMRTENSTSLKYSKAKLDGLMKTVKFTNHLIIDFYESESDLRDNEFVLELAGEKIYQCIMLLSSKNCNLSKEEKIAYLKNLSNFVIMKSKFSKAVEKKAKEKNKYRFMLYKFLNAGQFDIVLFLGKLKNNYFH